MTAFAKANPARLPLAMGIVQHGAPFKRMGVEQRTRLTDALVCLLRRFLTPIAKHLDLPGDEHPE